MNKIKTYLISNSKTIEEPDFEFEKLSSVSELNSIISKEPQECIVIDFTQKDFPLFFDLNYFLMMAKKYPLAQALAWRVNSGERLVTIDEQFLMTSEQEEPTSTHRDGLVRMPLYYFSKEESQRHINNDQIELALGTHGLPLAFPKAKIEYKHSQPALFLDRDGIINKDSGYLYKYEDLSYMEGVFSIIDIFNQRKWPVFVVTNQSGVAQGKYSEKDVISLHRAMDADIKSRGLSIQEWVFSPYHFEKGQGEFKKHSFTRKPGSAMALLLLEKYSIDIDKSFMIGDKLSDKILLKGLNFLQLKGAYPFDESRAQCFDSFEDIQKFILSKID